MAATDTFANDRIGMIGPITSGEAVSPHDTDELTTVSRGIYVGVSGDVKVKTVDGTTLTFVGLAAGIIHPIRAKQVFDTDTDATSIVAVW